MMPMDTPHPDLPATSGGRDAPSLIMSEPVPLSENEAQTSLPPFTAGRVRVGGKPLPNRTDARTGKARALRRSMTLEERIVWSQLKLLDIEGHFRRQVPIGPYFADFAHLTSKLVVEIDGGQHGSIKGLRLDNKRTAYLEGAGFTILRFWNEDVRSNRNGVIETILAEFNRRGTPHPISLPAMNGGRDAPSLIMPEPVPLSGNQTQTSLPPLAAGRD